MTPAHHCPIDMKQLSAYASQSKPITHNLAPKEELNALERDIEMHWELAAANLQKIKDRELWREGGYDSWKDYCERRWQMSRQRAYQLIVGVETVKTAKQLLQDQITAELLGNIDEASTKVDTSAPKNERQARALRRVPAAKRLKVLEAAKATGKVTAKAITTAAELLENGENLSDYKKVKRPATEAGKPKFALAVWKELEGLYGKALNRLDEANRAVPNKARHHYLIKTTKEMMKEVKVWQEEAR